MICEQHISPCLAVFASFCQGLLAGRLRELRSLREKGHSKGEDEEMDEG